MLRQRLWLMKKQKIRKKRQRILMTAQMNRQMMRSRMMMTLMTLMKMRKIMIKKMR